ncbi:T9SS type A sorting domain-containing protein, partial [candidate division WOR-3 bacterium]|nr:T9SS type A sorting domain-containing protein [candidate division WOR-3 bacterium]
GEYLFWKDVYKIDSCKNAKGEDILPLVENLGDSYYIALPGDTINIYTSTRCCDNANANGRSNRGGSIITGPGVKPKDKGKGKDIEPSIEIEYMGGKSWANGGEIYPREYIYAIYNDIPLSDIIRFVINNEVKIDYISFPISENVKYNEIKLELMNPTLKGKNVMKQIIKEDSAYINLITGDTLYFSFPLITSTNGEKVSYILETDGYYNIDYNKRDNSKSATIPKSDIMFISGIVYLQSKGKMYSNYEIYNISGRQVGQGEIKTGKIKIQKLCNGIYFIKLKGKHRSETHKFEVIR